jgi:hypothetical protein
VGGYPYVLFSIYSTFLFNSSPSANLENSTFVDALKKYHREGKSSNANIKQLLLNEHGIDVRYVVLSVYALI